MSAITPRKAFEAYRDLGPERSINALATALKKKGVKIGREKLTAWRNAEGWDELLAKGALPQAEIADIKASTAVMARAAEDLSRVTHLEDVMGSLMQMAAGLALTVTATIPQVEIRTVDDASTLARAATDIAKALNEIRQAQLGIGADSAKVIEATPVQSGPVSFLEEFKRSRAG